MKFKMRQRVRIVCTENCDYFKVNGDEGIIIGRNIVTNIYEVDVNGKSQFIREKHLVAI